MKKPEYLKYLQSLKVRSGRVMCAATAAIVGPTLDAMILNVESDGEDEKAKAYAEKVGLARAGDAEAKAEVTSIRLTRIKNFLFARSNWLNFFELQELQPAEIPYWQNESQQEVRAQYSGADGRPRKSQILKYQEQTQVQLNKISSEEFEYQLVDPYRGNIADEVKSLIDIGRDLDEQVSQKAKPFVTGAAVGTFLITGTKSSRTMTQHSILLAAGNLPTTNQLAPTSTHWGKTCLDAICKYIWSFGNVLVEGGLKIKAIYVPSSDMDGFLQDITVTSQTNSLSEQIMTEGQVVTYAGMTFTVIPDPTLKASDGFAYVQTNLPIGLLFTKPSLDKVYDDITPESRRENKGTMSSDKWIGFVAPGPWNPRVIRVKYK